MVLVAAGVLNVLKGLDLEEALASWALAAGLVWGRESFHVLHDGDDFRVALTRSAAVLLGSVAAAAVAVVAAAHWATPELTPGRLVGELTNSLTLTAGPISFRDPFDWLPAGLDVLWASAALTMGWLLFRPLPRTRGARTPPAWRASWCAATATTRSASSSSATTSSISSTPTRRAFVGYRVENGVLLVSGDPVGPRTRSPGCCASCARSPRCAASRSPSSGASERSRSSRWERGCASFYIGDEAIVELAAFSLEGRAIRKVRQSVTPLEQGGLRARAARAGRARRGGRSRELERVSARWRRATPERGFSMAIDSLRGDHLRDSVVVSRATDGASAASSTSCPSTGAPRCRSASCAASRDTPNGLTEFLVVRSIELLRERGVEELSLNFAAFARLHPRPARPVRAAARRGSSALGNPFFQIESLYRFNAKFFPRWEPRYLLYEGALGLPRAGLAAMWAEGQLPKPRLRSERG